MVVQAFLSHPHRGFAGHRVFRIDAVGRRQEVNPSPADPPSGWYGPFIVHYTDRAPGIAFGSALCLRRESSDLIFPLPERFRSSADEVVMALAPLMTPVIGVPAPLMECRCHDKNHFTLPHVTSESSDRQPYFGRVLWELRREYLGKSALWLG